MLPAILDRCLAVLLGGLIDADDQRHQHQAKTVGMQNAAQLAHRLPVVRDVLEDVRADEDIGRRVGISDVGQVDMVLHVAAGEVGAAISHRRIPLELPAERIGRCEVEQPHRFAPSKRRPDLVEIDRHKPLAVGGVTFRAGHGREVERLHLAMPMDVAIALDIAAVGLPHRLECAQPHAANRACVACAEIAWQLYKPPQRLVVAAERDVGDGALDTLDDRNHSPIRICRMVAGPPDGLLAGAALTVYTARAFPRFEWSGAFIGIGPAACSRSASFPVST